MITTGRRIKFLLIFSSDRMNLVIYSNQELEKIEEYVLDLFSQVKNKNLGKLSYADSPKAFTKNELSKIKKIKTISKTRKLTIKFILPSLKKEFRSDPLQILSFLIGHEGKGSLLSLLMKEGLVMELMTYPNNFEDMFTSFNIDFTLTEKGLKNYSKIIEGLYHYIAMLKREGYPENLFKEIQTVKNMGFEFRSKHSGLGKASELAELLPDSPPELINKIRFILEEYQPKRFQEILDLCIPENMLLELKNHEFEGLELRDEIYGTEYSNDFIEASLIKTIKEILESKLIIVI